VKTNLFYSLAHQAELGDSHSQTSVWKREKIQKMVCCFVMTIRHIFQH